MAGIIKHSDAPEQKSSVESVTLHEFVSPKRISDLKKEYDDLREKIEGLYKLSEKEGFDEGKKAGIEKGIQEGIEKGFQEGLKKGIIEGTENVVKEEGEILRIFTSYVEELKKNQVQYIKDNDKTIVTLVIEITKKILELTSYKDPETVLKITEKAIEKLSYSPSVVLHINPRDFEILELNREKMEKILSGVNNLRIEENPSIAKGSCRLETFSGVVDADFMSQLEVVRDLLNTSAELTTQEAPKQ